MNSVTLLRKLRDAIEELAEQCFDGGIEGPDFEDALTKHGIFVEVPASVDVRLEFETPVMLCLVWKEAEVRAAVQAEWALPENQDLI